MKLATGHAVTHDEAFIDARTVRFIADDGRTLFEVSAGKDGRSIEVRGVDSCRVDGVLYGSTIDIRPQVANCIIVRARLYDDQ